MNTEIEIVDGKIQISVARLIAAAAPSDLLNVIDSLACEDDVIEAVTAQMLDGMTAMMSHGYDDSRQSEPQTPLGKARRALALRAGEVAAAQIESLAGQLKEAKATIERMSAAAQDFRERVPWAWEMIHAAEFPMVRP